MSKARGLADLGNVYDDGALSNRNVLINGNFSVSQRGDFTTASTWGSGYLSYSLDRWDIKRSSMTGTIQDLGNRVKVVATTPTGTDQMMIKQIIEDKNINHLAGKTVTLSALVKTNRSDCRVMYELSGDTGWMGRNVDVSNNEHSGGGSDERLTATFSFPTDMTGVIVRVYVGFDTEDGVGSISLTAGDYFEAAEVQLEVGDTATPFEHPRSYSDELARCQRYYEQIEYSAYSAVAMGHAYNTTSLHGPFYYNEKRAIPTISVNNGVMCYNNATAQSPTTLGFGSPTKRSVNINPNNGMTFTANAASFIIAGASGFSVKLDAEL